MHYLQPLSLYLIGFLSACLQLEQLEMNTPPPPGIPPPPPGIVNVGLTLRFAV